MACASQAMISATSSKSFFSTRFYHIKKPNSSNKYRNQFTVRASSEDPDCNDEECAPDKEVGKVSMEWLAGEKTKVVGTFPPKKKGWTGYVEKDTAGQTNIYSVEPVSLYIRKCVRADIPQFQFSPAYAASNNFNNFQPTVYVAESSISSGTAGSSATGSENTAAVAAGIALISVAAASAILLQVNKNAPQIQTVDYTGPSLSYYINKFKPPEIIEAAVPSVTESSPSSVQLESSVPEVPQIQVQSEYTPAEPTAPSRNSES